MKKYIITTVARIAGNITDDWFMQVIKYALVFIAFISFVAGFLVPHQFIIFIMSAIILYVVRREN